MIRIGTPHVAGYSTDGKANGTSMSVRALAKFFGIPELTGWSPAHLPEPESPEIVLDPELPPAQQLAQALLHTYEIGFDDRNLRREPAGFEAQRGNYRVRREYPAFTVRGAAPEIRGILHRLGFTCSAV